jgi:hypothetical protein
MKRIFNRLFPKIPRDCTMNELFKIQKRRLFNFIIFSVSMFVVLLIIFFVMDNIVRNIVY